jgi:iron complex transport system permease protein
MAAIRARRATALTTGLVVIAVALAGAALLSLVVGSSGVPFGTILHALAHPGGTSQGELIVTQVRLPRTVIGLLAGAALGLAGAVAQGVTRNPLADPGILGVNAGAALFVVIGIFVLKTTDFQLYVWLGFAGAAVATVLVYSVAAIGRGGATPVKLALAGAAVTAALSSFTTAVQLLDVNAFDSFRFWQVGSLSGRGMDIAVDGLPFLAAGVVLAFGSARALNALALGDDVATSFGQNVAVARAVTLVALVLLCGTATAMAGPIAFVGLVIPHVARVFTGPDHRWLLPYAMLLGPLLLLLADVVGRVIARPGEVQVGIVTAVIGAPIFIALIRRRRLAEL